MNDQTEIPIESVPAKRAASGVTKQPDTITKPHPEDMCFTILADLPWVFSDPQCCVRFKSEIWRDEHDQVFVTAWHERDCEAWRYVP